MSDTQQPTEKKCGDDLCAITDAQPLAAFPRCKARKDGRALYCNTCCNRRSREYHRRRREKIAANKAARSGPKKPTVSEYPLADDLRNAVQRGINTFSGLRQETKKKPSSISDALAYLIFTTRAVRVERQPDGSRLYLPVNVPAPAPPCKRADSPLSFATLAGLMPRRLTGTR